MLRIKPIFSKSGNIRRAGKNLVYEKACSLLTTQRVFSLNKKGKKILRGGREGYCDESFHMNLSRGYSTVSPKVADYSSQLSDFGPFYKRSYHAFNVGWKKYTYWKGRTVVFPFSFLNSIMWHLDLIPNVVKEKIGDLQSMYCALPSYVGSLPTLTKFSTVNKGFKGKVDLKLLDSVDKHIYRLSLPKDVEPPIAKDVYHAKITPETHPGVITRKIAFNFSKRIFKKQSDIKKKHVLHYCVHTVLHCWDKISKGMYNDTSGVYCIGSREKISVIDENELLKTRPLMIPEFSDILHSSAWLEHLKTYWSKHGLFKSEIWLGHSDTKMRYYRRIEPEVKFKYSYDFDGKEWDSSVMPEVIAKAFNIYLSCYVKSDSTTNHFRFMMDTLVYKRIILHNGNTWLITKGVATGHVWTSFINSMVNWIIWTITLNSCPHLPAGVKENYDIQVQGDDVKIYCDYLLSNDTINKMLEWMLYEFNYHGKNTFCDPHVGLDNNPNGKSSFLKRVINKDGFLDMSSYDIFEKLLMGPEYSGLRSARYAYILRRFNDLAIYDDLNRKHVALYAAVVKNLEQHKQKDFKFLFEALFTATNGFTCEKHIIWAFFLSLTNIKVESIIKDSSVINNHLHLKYNDTYNTYDDACDYVDYWKERKVSVTVSHALRNFDSLLSFPTINIMDKMHYLKKKKFRQSHKKHNAV